MLGKTHLAIGVATALLVTQPRSLDEVAAIVIGGAIGGILPDIDVKIDTSNKFAAKASMDALYGEIAAISLSAAILLADWFKGGDVCREVVEKWPIALVGTVIFTVLTVIGERSEHRDKTHSLLFMALFTIATILIHVNIGAGFLIGYASHLLIDLLNKAPERLLYPGKKGICFKICYADRLGNDILFAVGLALTALYLYLLAA